MWIITSIISYFLNAIVSTIDKFLISKKFPSPITYAFFIGFLSIFAILLLPLGGLSFPPLTIIIISLIYGVLFVFGLLLFFESLKQNEASRAIPVIGSFVSLFTVILSFFILKESFYLWRIISLILLIGGGFLISFIKHKGGTRLLHGWPIIISTAFFFALSFVLTKYIYLNEPFISGFVWGRFGSFIFALSFLMIKDTRQVIKDAFKTTEKKTSILFLVNQAVSGVAFVALNYAISLGSVSVINALQGVQYIFVFLIAIFISKNHPHLFEEETSRDTLIQKIVSIILISIGLFILAFK